MNKLNASSFPDFFFSLWQKNPFAWQSALAKRVLENDNSPWPEAIALPTAAGKTACMDIAVFALAAQADRLDSGQPFTASRRIFFVVDRRVIVDEAFERSEELADKLRSAESGILKEVADRLRKLAGVKDPLACFQLRGGLFRSDTWAHSPIQPAIVSSTVDQIGSRLLFRAYGRGSRAWPIQAGLTGNDSLILLDEAHCAQPFLETLQAVRKYRAWAEKPISSAFHVVVMSATPPEGLDDVFKDASNEPHDPNHPLGARQQASKPTFLIQLDKSGSDLAEQIQIKKKEIKKAEGEKTGRNQIVKYRRELIELEKKASVHLAEKLCDTAIAMVSDEQTATVIFTNRVDTARIIHGILSEKFGNDAILLTGRMRPIDKDDIVQEQLAQLSATISQDRNLYKPVFVIATQTLEVGANLDFDILVSECASLDALRQRFGRLNRMGRKIKARAAIHVRPGQQKKTEDDPVYGSSLANTWAWLNKIAGKKHEIDMGIAAFAEYLCKIEDIAVLNAPPSHAPVMLPAHVDCWAQTNPEPKPVPDIALFLHGPTSEPADVQICWRADLTLDDHEAWIDTVSLCPPTPPECLSVSFIKMRKWLEDKTDSGAESDIEGQENTENTFEEHPNRNNRHVIRWRGKNDIRVISNPHDIFPGDVIIVPAKLEGWDSLATLGTESPIVDLGDRAYAQSKNKALLRIHPEVLKCMPPTKELQELSDIASTAEVMFEENSNELIKRLKTILGNIGHTEGIPIWLKGIAINLASDPNLAKALTLHPTGGLILRGNRYLNGKQDLAEVFSEEDDDLSSGTVMVEMQEHLNGVARYAEKFARLSGLSDTLVDTFKEAGLSHDIGKADQRFQTWIKGGNPWIRGPLLAKSGDMAKSYRALEKARIRAGYPKGGRHELVSVRLLESAEDLLPKNEELRDLMLHLIESHHGNCRPFAPVIPDSAPVSVTINHKDMTLSSSSATFMERLDSGVPERFWRLTRRYGWWGLAWLEAIFRLADHRRSESEEKTGVGDV